MNDCVTHLLLTSSFGSLQIGDILDEDISERYMYDNEELKRSKFYFSLLQLLRIVSEWITRSMSDLELAAEEWISIGDKLHHPAYSNLDSDNFKSELKRATKIITRNWDVVLALHRKEGRALLERTSRNTEAIESLRDGVSPKSYIFNQASANQSQSSSTHNQFERPSKALESTSTYSFLPW